MLIHYTVNVLLYTIRCTSLNVFNLRNNQITNKNVYLCTCKATAKYFLQSLLSPVDFRMCHIVTEEEMIA